MTREQFTTLRRAKNMSLIDIFGATGIPIQSLYGFAMRGETLSEDAHQNLHALFGLSKEDSRSLNENIKRDYLLIVESDRRADSWIHLLLFFDILRKQTPEHCSEDLYSVGFRYAEPVTAPDFQILKEKIRTRLKEYDFTLRSCCFVERTVTETRAVMFP